MLEITIDVLPCGDRNRRREIGKIEIVNLGKAYGRISSDYEYKLYDEAGTVLFTGRRIDSYNSNAFELIYECLACWKSGWLVSPDNHGLNGIKVNKSSSD